MFSIFLTDPTGPTQNQQPSLPWTLIQYFAILLLSCGGIFSCSSPPTPVESPPKVQLIFDTDFGGDADDLGALAMLNHFQNKGEIDLLGVMCWNTERYAVSAIDAVNTFYGNPAIPIGLRKDSLQETPWNHSKVITEHLPFDVVPDSATDATQLYRELLSRQADSSVVVVTVGPLLNIQRLINSPADQWSDLDGKTLLHQKVKEFVVMGGNFPKGTQEWNFDGSMPGVTQYVLAQLNLPITFLGFELGEALKTGEVFNELPKESPLYLGFYHFSQHAPWTKEQFKNRIHDNSTFDQTAVLYAVRGGVGDYWDRVTGGVCVADSTGGNTWELQAESKHSYLILSKPKTEMETLLEQFMLGKF